ncbi:MAG: metallophosphoesterase [Clostridia bacterium]|nr:metallophosphoesterase [Clostridia bacterium]
MKYYVVSDVHGFYDELIFALTEKGFFDEKSPHKLIICGDLLDRGEKLRRCKSLY